MSQKSSPASPFKPGPLLLVTWLDAHSEDDWTPLSEIPNTEHIICNTIGWAVGDDEKGLYLVSTFHNAVSGGEAAGSYTFVPRGMIRSVKEIKWDF